MFFLSGVARYLFVPLAEAVVFAMLASYAFANAGADAGDVSAEVARHPRRPRAIRSCCSSARSNAASSGCATATRTCWRRWSTAALIFVPLFLLVCVSAFLLLPLARPGLSSRHPTPASSSCTCAPRPARASRRPRASAIWWSSPSAARFRTDQLASILDDIGLPYSSINTIYSNSAPIGSGRRRYPGLAQRGASPHRGICARASRQRCRRNFQASTFYFLPADIVSQILEFRSARADRRSDRRQERGSQPRVGRPDAGPDAPRSRHRRSAHPAAVRSAQAAHLHRPHQGRGERITRKATWPRAC